MKYLNLNSLRKLFKATFLILPLALFIYLIVSAQGVNTSFAAVNDSTPKTFNALVDQGFNTDLTVQALGESLADNGIYTVTYRFTNPQHQDVSLPIQGMMHRCDQGNGHNSGSYVGVCVDLNVDRQVKNVSLNSGNNYSQDISFSIQQRNEVACGSFQSDIYSSFELNFITGSLYKTGKDVSTCAVTPTPLPSVIPTPSPSPSPSPTVTPIPTPTPVPTSTPAPQIITQNQEQSQTQNNNQNVNVTVTAPSSAPVVLGAQAPQILSSEPTKIKELPKTGLPLALWGISALAPIGFMLKKKDANSQDYEDTANSQWIKRQLEKE
jgi:hypothetical protein